MRVMGTIAALAVCSAAGCMGNGKVVRDVVQDGVRCGMPSSDGRVYVDISYASDGTPSVMPEECRVARGTRITWRGPGVTPFLLRFTPASPAGRGDPPEVRSGKTPNSQRIVIVANNAPGRYKYDIQANGITVDPAIIID